MHRDMLDADELPVVRASTLPLPLEKPMSYRDDSFSLPHRPRSDDAITSLSPAKNPARRPNHRAIANAIRRLRRKNLRPRRTKKYGCLGRRAGKRSVCCEEKPNAAQHRAHASAAGVGSRRNNFPENSRKRRSPARETRRAYPEHVPTLGLFQNDHALNRKDCSGAGIVGYENQSRPSHRRRLQASRTREIKKYRTAGKHWYNFFVEPSTRTAISFELRVSIERGRDHISTATSIFAIRP